MRWCFRDVHLTEESGEKDPPQAKARTLSVCGPPSPNKHTLSGKVQDLAKRALHVNKRKGLFLTSRGL